MMTGTKSYSAMEQKILKAIPADGTKVNTLDLVKCVYENEAPLTARQSVLDAANKLIIKADRNHEVFEIFRTKACGPMPIYFWRERRKTVAIKDNLFIAELQ